MFRILKRTVLGTPIPSVQAEHERLSKKRALAVFSSDALSSVAYATQEILLILVLAGSAVTSLSIPISIAIVGLLMLVVVSYRQTIYEYPNGGGAYIVAKENIGQTAGLVAGAALLIDYVLTVAVSMAAGVAAITSAFPAMLTHQVAICVLLIALLVMANLRGLRESAGAFAIPTYAFVLGILAMIAVGGWKLMSGEFTHLETPALPIHQPLTWFLLLKAFSSGCTAMAGVEAVSNGIPTFRHPESRNASITLIIMSGILAIMFVGITFLAHYHGLVPQESETLLSQLARSIFGTGGIYYFIQIMTSGILILAANTSFAGFPRLASILAKDRFLPRQLATLGDRLVFSNGIVALGVISALLVVLFKADPHKLIPLYAVGVFLSFSLSQIGMVIHWIRDKQKGWLQHMVVNAVGAVATTGVTAIFVTTKFSEGAWLITIAIPVLVLVFMRIKTHYLSVGKQLSLIDTDPSAFPETMNHTVLLPISGVHRGVLEALRYAQSIGADVRAVYVEIDKETTQRFQEEWQKWGRGVPLVVLKSPYRSVMAPLLKYIDEVESSQLDSVITVLIPEFVTAKWWQQLLHNQTAFLIRTALLFKRRKIVTSVRYHLN